MEDRKSRNLPCFRVIRASVFLALPRGREPPPRQLEIGQVVLGRMVLGQIVLGRVVLGSKPKTKDQGPRTNRPLPSPCAVFPCSDLTHIIITSCPTVLAQADITTFVQDCQIATRSALMDAFDVLFSQGKPPQAPSGH